MKGRPPGCLVLTGACQAAKCGRVGVVFKTHSFIHPLEFIQVQRRAQPKKKSTCPRRALHWRCASSRPGGLAIPPGPPPRRRAVSSVALGLLRVECASDLRGHRVLDRVAVRAADVRVALELGAVHEPRERVHLDQQQDLLAPAAAPHGAPSRTRDANARRRSARRGRRRA